MTEYPGYHYPKDTPSYPSHEHVWKYLNSYADRFGLKEHIKFHHFVDIVRPIRISSSNGKWEVIVTDLPNNRNITNTFDAVFVCNGRTSSPYMPQFDGAHLFRGKIMHSHDYRKPNPFQGRILKLHDFKKN